MNLKWSSELEKVQLYYDTAILNDYFYLLIDGYCEVRQPGKEFPLMKFCRE